MPQQALSSIELAVQQPQVQALLELALQEDLGDGDVTTAAIFEGPARVTGHIIARTATVACGFALAKMLLCRFDSAAQLTAVAPEGALVPANSKLLHFAADVRAVLTAERTLLNFLMRLCGIAAATRQAVSAVPHGSPTRIYDTRKTLPGWRILDKTAVRVGGGHNHRMGLFDAILIKDNHIAAAGSIAVAVQRARAAAGHTLELEVEIDRLDQLDEALSAEPDVILLDNFAVADIRAAVQRTGGRAELEISGGVTQASIPELAATGVARLSMGALTHSVVPADLSLEVLGP